MKTNWLIKYIAIPLFSLPYFGVGESWAANTIKTVEQVSSVVTLSDDIDYVITSTTPFTNGGVVNITNTEHAVIILQNIRPSAAISSWLGKYVQINGAKAVNNSNCQVRMYAQGAIILPYASSIKPLTVYSEQNFTGTAVNDFGLENSGGYMNTLSEAKLNNQIRSFKLKRGYMVTFSTRKEGRGYSRCFIADQEDLEMATLPIILDQTISSYRVFQWFNAPKKGLGSDTRADANAKLNSSWCYDWGTGVNLLPDVECVPNHIYEDWPSSSACGSVTYSCHMKTNNEPGNSADDHPQSVAEVLANWENLMRTGMRLCSESSHDGSMNHLKAFIDSIDARGWRCDVLDLHCYWRADQFNEGNLTWYSNNYGNGRPIWISEWVWGASWNNNGAFAVSNRNDYEGNWANCYNGTKPILDVLNKHPRVERYAYWNSEANCSKILLDGKLSTLGEYYANMTTGLGYNKANEFIPKNPRMHNPSNLVAKYDNTSQQVTLTWHEPNGEYNKSMEIQVREPNSSSWRTVQQVALKEEEADYEVSLAGMDGNRYRIRVMDVNSKERLTNEAYAVNESLSFGDGVTVLIDNTPQTMYLGGNRLLNGDFLLGNQDWTNGVGEPIAPPYFEVVPEGGVDNSPFLQCYGNNTTAKHAQSLRKVMKLEPGSCYYVEGQGAQCNANYQHIASSRYESLENNIRVRFPEVSDWTSQASSFQVVDDTILLIQLRGLAGMARFDEFRVCRLFPTRDEALADAYTFVQQRAAQMVETYGSEWFADVNSQSDANALEQYLQDSYKKMVEQKRQNAANTLMSVREKELPFRPTSDYYQLVTTALKNPTFASESGWQTKSGTYKGGDQRLATQADKTCWNAWWSLVPKTGEHPTMSIQQTTSALSHGLYALECKATTQHLCITDQHGWMANGQDTLRTLPLSVGKLDLPAFANDEKWSTLTSSYTYVDEGGTLTVGFTGSKSADDCGKFMAYGNPTSTPDNREGWWCATDFKLRYIPMLERTVDASGWGSICLPAAFDIPEGVSVYQSAGILADGTAIALEGVTATQPAYPYLFKTEPNSTVCFFEHGEKSGVIDHVNGFYGELEVDASLCYFEGGFKFENGEFVKVTTFDDPIPAFSVHIMSQDMLPVVATYNGVTVPIVGAEPSGINHLKTDWKHDTLYNLSGQRTNIKGLVIKNGQVVFQK